MLVLSYSDKIKFVFLIITFIMKINSYVIFLVFL